jgi:hypothetical protein
MYVSNFLCTAGDLSDSHSKLLQPPSSNGRVLLLLLAFVPLWGPLTVTVLFLQWNDLT